MGFILTLIVVALAIFLSAGLVTAVRRHGWTVGVRRYGAALVSLGVGVGHAVARPALDGQEAAGDSSQDATVADILGDMMVPAETPGFEGGEVDPSDPYYDHTNASHPYYGYTNESLEVQLEPSLYEEHR